MTAIPELTSSSSSASSSYLTRDAVHSFFDRVMDMFLSSSDVSSNNNKTKKVKGVAADGDYHEHSAWAGEDEEDVLLTQGQMQVNRILMNKGLHLNGESSSSGSGDDSSDEDDDEFDDEDDGSAAVDDSHRHKREKEHHHSVHHTPSFPSLVVGGVRMLDFSRTSHRDRTIFYGTHLRPILTAITERTEEDSMSLANSQSIRPSFSSSQTSSDIATAFSNLSQALRMAKTSSFSAYAGTSTTPSAAAAGRGTAAAAAYDSGDSATANNTSSSSLSTTDESIQKAKSSSKKLRKTKSSSSHRSVKSAGKDEKQLKKSNSRKESNLATWVDVSDTEEETDEEASR